MKTATSSYQISYTGWLFTFLLAPALLGPVPAALAQGGTEGPDFRPQQGPRGGQGGGYGPQAFRQEFQGRPSHRDLDNNPPGMRGGRGTNWENRPGPQDGAGPDFRSKQENAKRLERFDTDQNGRLNQEEKYAAREQRQKKRSELRERFDLNQDGQLDQQEKQQARTQWLEKHPEMRERLDANEDGQINREDRQAARQQWLEEHPELKERIDANHDGEIDQAERQNARQQWQQHRDRGDNNPLGKRGGRGTHWENRPGPQGGPGTSPNRGIAPESSEPQQENSEPVSAADSNAVA